MTAEEDKDKKWHIEKGVPLALIGTLVMQSVVIVWWASSISQRVNELERNAMAAVPRLESVIRLETKVDVINSTLQELKAIINGRK